MDKELQEATSGARIHFKRKHLHNAKQLLKADLWDTYKFLIDNARETYIKYQEHANVIVSETNIKIAILHTYYKGAIECVIRHRALPWRRILAIKEKLNNMKTITPNDL